MEKNYTLVGKKTWLAFLGLIAFIITASASQPLKIDINMTGRSEAEVNQSGYIPWVIQTGKTATKEFGNGISITLSSEGDGNLRANWYKAGILDARLANDGILINDIPSGSENVKIKMEISGLSAGRHSLLTYHSHVDNPATNTFAPIKVWMEGKDSEAITLIPPVRVGNNADAAKYYNLFEVTQGDNAVFYFEVTKGVTEANNKTIVINGIEIDTPNPDAQASKPVPLDADEHVDGDGGNVTLQWTSPEGTVLHHVYFGTDSVKVENAGQSDPEYKGSQTDTSYPVNNVYSMDSYFWRIDEVDPEGIVMKGNVWNFRTRQLAFEGAEGYGRFARGGRGGIVVKVTNLNDDGPGSLRDAVDNPAYQGIPRTIIFDVSGRIQLSGRLSVNKPYITIAGQTAPGKGICVSGHAFGIGGVNDVIIRHMRLRVGTDETTDGMGQSGSNHCIIDHASISWSKDEATSSRDAFNITFQRNLISEPLNRAGHKNYEPGKAHGFAGSIGGDVGSYHHNLLVHCYGRNWSLAGGLDGNGYYKGRLDIFNNIVYNWGQRTTDGGAHEVNFVNNYYKPGIETGQFRALNAQWDGFPGTQRYYCNGNFVEGKYENLTDPLNACTSSSKNPDPWSDVPFFPSYATVHTAKDAYKHVISDAGATQPMLDNHDNRIIEETLAGSWTFRGSYNAPNGTRGIIDHQNDVGGWEDYGKDVRPADYDSDNDGLPDWWENIIGTDPNSPEDDFSDSNADTDKDGFTNFDDFLGWIGQPNYVLNKGDILEIDLHKLSRGFTANPVYSAGETDKCNVTVDGHIAKVSHTLDSEALGSFTFTVKDSEGTEMTRKIGLRLTGSITGINENTSTGLRVNYNNPVKDILSISVSSETTENVNILVLDISGKHILTRSNIVADGQVHTLDMSSLPQGVYFININTGKEQKLFKVMRVN